MTLRTFIYEAYHRLTGGTGSGATAGPAIKQLLVYAKSREEADAAAPDFAREECNGSHVAVRYVGERK